MGLSTCGRMVIEVEQYHPDGFYYGGNVAVEWDDDTGYVDGEMLGRMYANSSLSEREVERLEEELIEIAIDEFKSNV